MLNRDSAPLNRVEPDVPDDQMFMLSRAWAVMFSAPVVGICERELIPAEAYDIKYGARVQNVRIKFDGSRNSLRVRGERNYSIKSNDRMGAINPAGVKLIKLTCCNRCIGYPTGKLKSCNLKLSNVDETRDPIAWRIPKISCGSALSPYLYIFIRNNFLSNDWYSI